MESIKSGIRMEPSFLFIPIPEFLLLNSCFNVLTILLLLLIFCSSGAIFCFLSSVFCLLSSVLRAPPASYLKIHDHIKHYRRAADGNAQSAARGVPYLGFAAGIAAGKT